MKITSELLSPKEASLSFGNFNKVKFGFCIHGVVPCFYKLFSKSTSFSFRNAFSKNFTPLTCGVLTVILDTFGKLKVATQPRFYIPFYYFTPLNVGVVMT